MNLARRLWQWLAAPSGFTRGMFLALIAWELCSRRLAVLILEHRDVAVPVLRGLAVALLLVALAGFIRQFMRWRRHG